jgi:hypothetical protein
MSEWTGIGTFHSNKQTGMTTGMELTNMLHTRRQASAASRYGGGISTHRSNNNFT